MWDTDGSAYWITTGTTTTDSATGTTTTDSATITYPWNPADTGAVTWSPWIISGAAYSYLDTGTAPTVYRPVPSSERRTFQEIRAARRRQAIAAEKAMELLLRHLTPRQRRDMERHRHFTVVSQSGRRYQIDVTKEMHNVFELDAHGERRAEHCIYTPRVPLGDGLLHQKLMLEANEPLFREIANQTRIA